MKPKKQLIETAQENGSLERMNKLLSAAHILACVGNNLIEEANDLMIDNGLLLGSLKKDYNDYARIADKYMAAFAILVGSEKAKMDMFSDMDEAENMFRKWAKL